MISCTLPFIVISTAVPSCLVAHLRVRLRQPLSHALHDMHSADAQLSMVGAAHGGSHGCDNAQEVLMPNTHVSIQGCYDRLKRIESLVDNCSR